MNTKSATSTRLTPRRARASAPKRNPAAAKPSTRVEASEPPPPAAPPPEAQAPQKSKKIKLVRDGFTIPKNEVQRLQDLKLRAARLGQPAKKSEIIRAGLAVLAGMDDATLIRELAAIPSLKTGRPKGPQIPSGD